MMAAIEKKTWFRVASPLLFCFLPMSSFSQSNGSFNDFLCFNRYAKFDSSSFSNLHSRQYSQSIFATGIISNGKTIPGTTEEGGFIYDVDLYVSSAHPAYVFLGDGFTISNYSKKYMSDTSVYVSSLGSEGNCILNATYSMFDNMARHGWNGRCSDNYNGSINYSRFIQSDPLYEDMINGSFPTETGQVWKVNDNYLTLYGSIRAIDSMSCLYLNIRSKAIELGYVVDGFPFYYTGELFRRSAALSGYDVGVSSSSAFSAWAESNIRNGVPVVVTAAVSKVYKDHAMCVYGYKKYVEYVIDSDGNPSEEVHYMYLVDDGYTPEVRWYDPTAALANYYFSCSRSSLVFSVC